MTEEKLPIYLELRRRFHKDTRTIGFCYHLNRIMESRGNPFDGLDILDIFPEIVQKSTGTYSAAGFPNKFGAFLFKDREERIRVLDEIIEEIDKGQQ